jgi:hypothetical protein
MDGPAIKRLFLGRDLLLMLGAEATKPRKMFAGFDRRATVFAAACDGLIHCPAAGHPCRSTALATWSYNESHGPLRLG